MPERLELQKGDLVIYVHDPFRIYWVERTTTPGHEGGRMPYRLQLAYNKAMQPSPSLKYGVTAYAADIERLNKTHLDRIRDKSDRARMKFDQTLTGLYQQAMEDPNGN